MKLKYCHFLFSALGISHVDAAFMIPNNSHASFHTNSVSSSLPSTLPSTPSTPSTSTLTLQSSTQQEQEESEKLKEFKLRTKQLCSERNLKLEKVKNARDLSSVRNSTGKIKPGRIIRTGRVSDATLADLGILYSDCNGDNESSLHIKTLVDLRSYTELKDDPTLDREEVFQEYTDLVWDERKDVVKVLNEGRSRVEKKKNIVGHVRKLVGGAKKGGDAATTTTTTTTSQSVEEEGGLLKVLTSAAELADATEACSIDAEDHSDHAMDEDLCDGEEKVSSSSSTQSNGAKKRFSKTYQSRDELVNDQYRANDKERHFVSIMNEMKYVKGTLSKVRKRDLAKALIKSPGAIVSKRVRNSCKDVFLSRINDGGLHMLNELLLKQGAPGIKYVLDLCKDKSRHPIAFYCTAGKDRTGMIAAIMLAAAGVPDEDIVEDYSLSANVYAEMNDHKAMVGALSQRNLDAKTFLGAPPEVMRDTLANIRSEYGSIDGYLDKIGFTEEDRKELRAALVD